nr:oligopeptide/dipeptide ABC transporter ATP-binding protein [uncultured Oscillibacter sp.]
MTKARERAEQLRQELARPYGGENLLEVRHLKKYFRTGSRFLPGKGGHTYIRAVDDVSFTVKSGQTLGIVGESGCGKSTTGNTIIRLLEKTSGEVYFQGHEISDMSKEEMEIIRPNIQMIFQDPYSSLNPRMRVFDIIAEPLRTHRVCKSERELREQVLDMMSVVGLQPDYASRYPHEFSGGQRQRIGIARALALRPKLIICDEPVSALDVSIQAQVLNLLASLQKEFHLSYMFIAHGLPTVKHVSDRIAVMYLGQLVELAGTDELCASPCHPYTEGLLAAIPIPDPALRRERSSVLLQGDLPSPANPPSGCRFHTRCVHCKEICEETVPAWREVRPGHFVACHFPVENGRGILERQDTAVK